MLINFNHHLFRTKLDCSAVSLDGYSPSNLLSPNWREKKQGFMAAHFIKPPVFLLFQFAFPIQIHSVAIKPKVGSQISTGFDILVAGIKSEALESAYCARKGTKSCDVNELKQQQQLQQQQQKLSKQRNQRKRKCDELDDKTLSKDDNIEETLHVPKREKTETIPEPKYNTTITIESFKNSHRNVFTLVSRINDQSGKILRVVNRTYSEEPNSCTFEGAIEYDFFHANVLGYVTHLMVIINRVKGSCVPCLGMLEIWGKPSINCGESVIENAYEIQKQINGQHGDIHVHSSTKVNQKTCPVKKDEDIIINNDDDIPNDFRDPITCNLMTIPMLLPSGLNIDMTTLEKHSNAERQWGRMPSDPFTGVVFTNTVKPIPNSALKVRIDKYILSSGIDVNGYGRALGRISNKQDAKVSMTRINKGKVIKCTFDRRNSKSSNSNVCGSKRITEDGFSTDAKSELKLSNEEIIQCRAATSKTKVVESHVEVVHSHEEQISNSLDDALIKTLQGATFTRKKATVDPISISCSSLVQDGSMCTPSTSTTSLSTQPVFATQEPKTCISCKVTLDTAFRLPCQHLLCRKCLLLKCSSSKNPVCYLCKQPFLRKEAIRAHTV